MLLVGSAAAAAQAQATDAQQSAALQEVVVTGSNIRRSDDSMVPISVNGEETMEVCNALLSVAGSLEIYDCDTLQPVATHSIGLRLSSLTWAVRHNGFWWACFANYNDSGTTPGFDQRWSHMAQLDDKWQELQSWLFPPQVIATWGDSSCSGGDWGDDGLLYVTGHDAPQLHVLRLPQQGVTLEYVTTIDVPFEGQSWAWDRSVPGERIIYGISRARQEVISAYIPPLPSQLL